MQPRPQGAFPWLCRAREKRPGDEVGAFVGEGHGGVLCVIIFSILITLFIGTTFILDRGENDYFPLVRLVKNTFVPMLHFKKATLKSFLEMYVNKLILNFIIMIQIISKL